MSSCLRVDWCSYQAAKYAVMHWHYSKAMPAGKIVKMGVWEDGKFIGSVIYGWGANRHIGGPYNLRQTEVCELVRVALRNHSAPVSRIVSLAQKMLVAQSSGLRLIVSYADPYHGHNGAIYQAMNWVYIGKSDNWRGSHYIIHINGMAVEMHGRSVRSKWGREASIPYPWEFAPDRSKHKYLYPLDRAMRRQITSLAQPYPKRAGG